MQEFVESFERLSSARVLSYIECRTAALYHGCDTHLSRLDATQRAFLREVNLTEMQALSEYNLAPLEVRRDVAMLGLIHRTVLGKGPPHFNEFFQRVPAEVGKSCTTRKKAGLHNKQLKDIRDQ